MLLERLVMLCALTAHEISARQASEVSFEAECGFALSMFHYQTLIHSDSCNGTGYAARNGPSKEGR